MKNKFPWPVKDRDVVSKLWVQKITDDTIKLYNSATPEEIPRTKTQLKFVNYQDVDCLKSMIMK